MYSLFPITHLDAYKMYKQAAASFWVVEEVDLSRDHEDLERMSADEKHLLFTVLAFFAASDAIVNENLVARFYEEIDVQEIRQFYAMQIAMEAIHSEMYSILIDTYVKDTELKARLFNGIETTPCIRRKADFCLKYMDKNLPLNERLVAYACVEGILFSASFAVIFYFKKRGMMPGLTLSNEFIARDEGLHSQFSVLVYKTFEELPHETITEIVKESVDAEIQFVRTALTTSVLGFSTDDLEQYVRFIADRLLFELGCSKNYNVPNPLEWMDLQSMNTKTNFFESRVSEYAKPTDTAIDWTDLTCDC